MQGILCIRPGHGIPDQENAGNKLQVLSREWLRVGQHFQVDRQEQIEEPIRSAIMNQVHAWDLEPTPENIAALGQVVKDLETVHDPLTSNVQRLQAQSVRFSRQMVD
jgi:hypothetical protein